ncbi:hypothetical protein [Nocardia farcinica]|uniref:hypothetical protein n=1 Tax=Nocardia farcinica TaxID=37329 RepID=UPI0024558753|nr:hypothetical protein [Nocardia farcinica]
MSTPWGPQAHQPFSPGGHPAGAHPRAGATGDPVQDETQRYLAAVTHQHALGRLHIGRQWIGPVLGLTGVGQAVATALNPIELAVCVADVAEVTPQAAADFPHRVDEFARSLRRRSAFVVKGGVFGVAALVSHRVHPAAIQGLRNRPMSYGSVIVPVLVDLGQRRVHIPANTPVMGFAVWGSVRKQAEYYLPDPRWVLG